jgi:hypothetical protein
MNTSSRNKVVLIGSVSLVCVFFVSSFLSRAAHAVHHAPPPSYEAEAAPANCQQQDNVCAVCTSGFLTGEDKNCKKGKKGSGRRGTGIRCAVFKGGSGSASFMVCVAQASGSTPCNPTGQTLMDQQECPDQSYWTCGCATWFGNTTQIQCLGPCFCVGPPVPNEVTTSWFDNACNNYFGR